MEVTAYQTMAARTINEDLLPREVELHALHGMVGELGEIHSIYQKAYQGHEVDENHLKKEIGDLMWFVAELCTINDWSLDEICNDNIAKLYARYPHGFDVEHSVNRAEGDI